MIRKINLCLSQTWPTLLHYHAWKHAPTANGFYENATPHTVMALRGKYGIIKPAVPTEHRNPVRVNRRLVKSTEENMEKK
jgi:hypothetical protein